MAALPRTEHVLTDLAGGWLTIWLNRPEARNALSSEMAEELFSVLQAVRDDRSVRGITFRGKGGVFCAGGDIKGFRAIMQAQSVETVTAFSRRAGELFHLVNEMPQVTVMLVEGAAMAGGLGLACAGDVVAVTRDARFALTETTLGIPPAQIAPLVAQRIGLAAARRIMLTAASFDGSEALRIGIADFVADDAAGLEAIEACIKASVSRCAPGANAAAKEILLAAPGLGRDAMLDFAAQSFARAMLGEEGREGIAAFLEKRQPRWAEEPGQEDK